MVEFVNNRTLFFGTGSIDSAVSLIADKGARKVFAAVFDSKAVFVLGLLEKMHKAGIETIVYDKFSGEPNLEVVDDAVRHCVDSGCDYVVACGGGTVIDTAKLVAMMATNGGCCEDYQLNGRPVTQEPLFFVAVPTTAGTGAEATRVSVIYNEKKGFKKACYDNALIAQAVVLDPDATARLPGRIAASTGMDAIIHAVESYVSKNANAITKMYSRAALELLYSNIEQACTSPENIEARSNMQLGSYLAGLALSAGSGLAHIVGQPMGAVYHIPHGEACSAVFLASIRMNRDYAEEGYRAVANAIGIETNGVPYDIVFDQMTEKLTSLMKRIGVPCGINECVPRERFDPEGMVDNICACMSHIKCNPRPTDAETYRQTIDLAMEL